VTVTPAAAKSGRSPAKRSSITHCEKGSALTIARSIEAGAIGKRGDIGFVGRRHDAVDHRLREGAKFAIQSRERGIARGEHGVAQLRAIIGEIVAADRGEWRQPAFPAEREPFGEEAGSARIRADSPFSVIVSVTICVSGAASAATSARASSGATITSRTAPITRTSSPTTRL
jgi:hypothetical protein